MVLGIKPGENLFLCKPLPTAILFEVIMCLLPDDSQINIFVVYIFLFSLFITCQETSLKLPTASIILAISAENN
jgi:hypothetical protein